jgi:hypothetical protein
VRDGVARFIEETSADELMVTAQIYDHAARVRSYEILADVAMGSPAPTASVGAAAS